MVVNNGKYPVEVTGQLIVYETGDGALCVAVPLAITETENNPAWEGKTTITLVKKDGTVMTKSWDNLKKCFAWDGQDPFWLMYENPEDEASAPRDFSALFETEKLSAIMEQEEFTPENGEPYTISKVKFLNPPGGFANMPAPADRKSVLAKYASKFRALGGGSTSAPSAPQAAPKAPGKAPVAPGKTPAKTPAKAPPVATKLPPLRPRRLQRRSPLRLGPAEPLSQQPLKKLGKHIVLRWRKRQPMRHNWDRDGTVS
jgi:hypothetical protein